MARKGKHETTLIELKTNNGVLSAVFTNSVSKRYDVDSAGF
jgi:hypothetical protein